MSIHIIIELNENIVDETHAIEHAREIAHQLGRCANEVRVESGRDTLIEMSQGDFDAIMEGATVAGQLEVKRHMLELAKTWAEIAESDDENMEYRNRARARSATLSHYAKNHI